MMSMNCNLLLNSMLSSISRATDSWNR